MRKFLSICFITMLFCSCSTFKLANTLWYTESEVISHGEKAELVTSLLFSNNNVVEIRSCVKQDSTILVPPAMMAIGTYKQEGNLKKGIHVTINQKRDSSLFTLYEGVLFDKGMVLVGQDSIAKGYKMAEKYIVK